MKKVCIIGKGSIGIRHAKIFKKLGCEIFFLRSYKNLKNYKLNFKVNELNNFSNIKKFFFDLIVIANPSSLHVKTFEKYIKFSRNFFIEKPISTNLKNFKKFISIKSKNNCNVYSGYFLRFNPNIIKLKKIILKKGLKIKSSNFVWHTNMPEWHKNEDYNKSYASNKKFGGGVLLTCSHEIDLAIFLFGSVKEVFCYELKSDLKINVESSVIIILKHNNKVLSQIKLDFLSLKQERFIQVYLKKSNIILDYTKNFLLEKSKDKTKKIIIKKHKKLEDSYFFQNQFILKNIHKHMRDNFFKEITYTEKVIQCLKLSLKRKKVIRVN